MMTCRSDRHPAPVHDAVRTDPGSSLSSALVPRHAIRCRDSLQTGNYPHSARIRADYIAAFPSTRSRALTPAAKLLFAFITLTACRSGEAWLSRWSEVDLEARVWTVPADRMKAKREHHVPLVTQAVEVLTEARRLIDGSGLIFLSPTGRGPLSDNTVIKLCHELRLGCTPHGMRSSFRTWCSETEQRPELAK